MPPRSALKMPWPETGSKHEAASPTHNSGSVVSRAIWREPAARNIGDPAGRVAMAYCFTALAPYVELDAGSPATGSITFLDTYSATTATLATTPPAFTSSTTNATFTVANLGTFTVTANGKTFKALVRIDTPQEALYYANGGILQYVLRQLLGKA